MIKKLITKSFERLLDKGLQRGFITYEELGKSLGKRNSTQENVERAIFIIFEKKVSLVEKKGDFQKPKKKDTSAEQSDKTSSAFLNASWRGAPAITSFNLSFGITMRVSTFSASLAIPSSA